MRKLLLFLILFISYQGFSQREQLKNLPNYDKKWVHFGFTVGLNTMDFDIQKSADFLNNNEVYAIENTRQVGFHIGPISSFRISDYLEFRALITLSFGQRDLTYWRLKDTLSPADGLSPQVMKIASTFLEFPLLLKYKAVRINNYAPYVIAGFNPKYDLAARKKIKPEEMPKVRLDNFDPSYELGFGIDFYLEYFRLSAELKYSAGIRNILIPDGTNYTNSVDKLSSRMIMFSLHFE